MIRGLATFRLAVFISIFSVLLGGCWKVHKLDPSLTNKYEGFIQNGKTTRQQVQNRLGSADSSYENGRILIYHVFIDKYRGMNLQGKGACHACVLVFDNNNVLENHSLVKHGCGE